MTNLLHQHYEDHGHVAIPGLVPKEVAANLLSVFHSSLSAQPGLLSKLKTNPSVNTQPAYEFYGFRLPSAMTFHWGMTSRVSEIAERPLLPTYAYFRAYLKGDRCLIHSDRPSCEHSLSLSLGFSDDEMWPLEIGNQFRSEEEARDIPKADDFGDEPYSGLELNPGDGMFYKGINYRHGRQVPNPNRWSAHLFLHWVDAEGPYKEFSFDRVDFPNKPDFPAFT